MEVRGKLIEVSCFFHCVGPGTQTQIVKFCVRHLYPLRHFTCPIYTFLTVGKKSTKKEYVYKN